jgi:hypothetical protein
MLSGVWMDQLRLHWRRPTAAQECREVVLSPHSCLGFSFTLADHVAMCGT